MTNKSISSSVRSTALYIVAITGAVTVSSNALPPPSHVTSAFNRPGNVLISDQFNNRVIEADPTGKILWQFGLGPNDFSAKSPLGVNDAERVGMLTLVAATGIPAGVDSLAPDGVADNRVLLVSSAGRIIWTYGQFGRTGDGFNQLNVPVQATYLANGHILITDQGNNRVIEVNTGKIISWQYPGSNSNPDDQLSDPNSAELLGNGNVLIADEGNSRVLEVNRKDQIVHTFTAGGTLGEVAFASRLKNGNTLITDAGNERVVEVDSNDNVVWTYYTNTDPDSATDPAPTRAVRLQNGDTLISDQFNNRVIRVNGAGDIVMSYGLPLDLGDNWDYDTKTTQGGLFAPYDAKIIGDYTGLTSPSTFHF